MASRIERLRNIFLLVFFLLVITIIFTPLIVRSGFTFFPEETMESVLLFIQVAVGWRVFRLYERSVESREKEIQKLEGEYQRREKELLEAFAYLGKVNVQISLIQTFLQKIRAPSSRKEAETYINEILTIALTLSGKKWVTLRAMDAKTLQTLNEYWAKASPEIDTNGIKIGNKDIANWAEESGSCQKDGYCIYASAGSKISPVKVYLVFLNGENIERDVQGFLQAAANQCEVLLTLYNLSGNK